MKTPRLTVLEKIGFGAGDMAVNVVWSSMALILTFFYTDIFGLKPADIALLMLLPRLIDAFADVAMGMITDKYMTRWGRYRPYRFYLPFLSALRHVGVHNAGIGLQRQTVLGLRDLHPDDARLHFGDHPVYFTDWVLTEDPQERLSANGYRLFFAKVAAFMVTIIYRLWPPAGEWTIARGYQISMALMAGMAILLFLFCFFTTTERVKHNVEGKPLLLQLGGPL